MFQPNTVQIPRFIVGALLDGSISLEEFAVSTLISIGVDPYDQSFLNGYDEQINTAQQALEHGRFCKKKPSPTTEPPKVIAKAVTPKGTVKVVAPTKPSVLRNEDKPSILRNEDKPVVKKRVEPEPDNTHPTVSPEFSEHTQSQIDNNLSRPLAIPERRMQEIFELVDGNTDAITAAVKIMKDWEANNSPIVNPTGFLFKVIRDADSPEHLIRKAEQITPVKKRDVFIDTYYRVMKKMEEQEIEIPEIEESDE